MKFWHFLPLYEVEIYFEILYTKKLEDNKNNKKLMIHT